MVGNMGKSAHAGAADTDKMDLFYLAVINFIHSKSSQIRLIIIHQFGRDAIISLKFTKKMIRDVKKHK